MQSGTKEMAEEKIKRGTGLAKQLFHLIMHDLGKLYYLPDY